VASIGFSLRFAMCVAEPGEGVRRKGLLLVDKVEKFTASGLAMSVRVVSS